MRTVFLSALLLFSFLSFSQSVNISIQGKIVNSNFKEAWLKRWRNDSLAFQNIKINDDGSFFLKQKYPLKIIHAFPGDVSIELVLKTVILKFMVMV